MILAIGSRNDFVHVYRSEGELIADNSIGAGPGRFSGPIEFFDSDGRQFTGVNDEQGNLRALNPTGDSLDLPVFLQRVRNAFAPLRSFLAEHPEESVPEVTSALGQLSSLSSPEDLRNFLQVFVVEPGSIGRSAPDREQDPGSPGHNALHRMGINH